MAATNQSSARRPCAQPRSQAAPNETLTPLGRPSGQLCAWARRSVLDELRHPGGSHGSEPDPFGTLAQATTAAKMASAAARSPRQPALCLRHSKYSVFLGVPKLPARCRSRPRRWRSFRQAAVAQGVVAEAPRRLAKRGEALPRSRRRCHDERRGCHGEFAAPPFRVGAPQVPLGVPRLGRFCAPGL